jgi:phosphatidylserine/phosphatidylglycerophosphate/cardiolipin synthase-like enzyme
MDEHARQDTLAAMDRRLGDGLERAVSAHHRRRLRSLGRGEALSPGPGLWVAGDPPPRAGNFFDLLVDGEHVFPRMMEALQAARSHVILAGWALQPGFALIRGGGERVVLHDLLAELAERIPVRVLLWAGAPLPVFRPWRRQVTQVARQLTKDTRIQVALDSRERPLHTHHEKVVVIDGERAFVGGLDLTDAPADRFDRSAHPYRHARGWHDVGSELRGPIVGDALEHLALRWQAVTGETIVEHPVSWNAATGNGHRAGASGGARHDVTLQFATTVPEHRYPGAWDGTFRILEAYLRAIRSAQRFIYLESQFLWSPEIVSALREKLIHPPTDRFRLVLLLPSRANSGEDATRGQLAVLAEADHHGERFLAATLFARTAGVTTAPVYIHAKVGIVDDAWLTVGSANLNDHSLFNDTEVNVVTTDPGVARAARLRLWSEHLEAPEEDLRGDPADVIDGLWRPIARDQLARRREGRPMTHRLAELPHVSKRTRRLLGPVDGLLFDG